MIDKGYYRDIPQLAKPKGNERQGFRGDDAYGGGRDPSGPGPSGTGNGGPTGPQELGMTTRGPKGPDDRGNKQQNINQKNIVREARIRAVEDLIDRPTFGFTDAAKYNLLSPTSIVGGIGSLLSGVPGLGLAVTGLKKGFDFFGDSLQGLRGFNPDGSPRTQQEYEDYMAEKSLQDRYDNLMDRKLTGKSYSERNLQSLMDMGLTSSKDSLASAIERDLTINPETIQSLAQPNVATFGNPIGPRAVNVPGAGIMGINVNLPGNNLMAGLTKMQQKMLAGPQKNLRNIMGISDQEILNNISPFNDPNDPATLEEVQEFYRT